MVKLRWLALQLLRRGFRRRCISRTRMFPLWIDGGLSVPIVLNGWSVALRCSCALRSRLGCQVKLTKAFEGQEIRMPAGHRNMQEAAPAEAKS
jgi:hypothetical protein